MKFCTKCKTSKSFSEFNKNSSRKDGYASMCRACWKLYYAEYYKSGKEKARLAKRRDADRKVIREYLIEAKNVPCMDCKKSYPFYVMQFDHRNPAEKDFTIAHGMNFYGLERIKQEVAKCDVVCSNCHAERTWGDTMSETRPESDYETQPAPVPTETR